MIRLRVRFRIFLLLTTLASLIAAFAAIRTRLVFQEVAEDHAFRAYQARVLAESWQENIKWAEGMEKSSVITADKARYRATSGGFDPNKQRPPQKPIAARA
jgi:hypothetical protein